VKRYDVAFDVLTESMALDELVKAAVVEPSDGSHDRNDKRRKGTDGVRRGSESTPVPNGAIQSKFT